MVILEIERSFRGFDGLLGEHRWSEFLKSLTNEEKDHVSKILGVSTVPNEFKKTVSARD